MSATQARLDAYLAAEARILTAGFSIRFGERQRQEAELASIQKAITALQAQLGRETAASNGRSGLSYAVADFTGHDG